MEKIKVSGNLEIDLYKKENIRDDIGCGLYRQYLKRIDLNKEEKQNLIQKIKNKNYILDINNKEVIDSENNKHVCYFEIKNQNFDYFF